MLSKTAPGKDLRLGLMQTRIGFDELPIPRAGIGAAKFIGRRRRLPPLARLAVNDGGNLLT